MARSKPAIAEAPIPVERIQRAIYLLRSEKVMLDADLAVLYGVTTGNLNKAVQRNQDRFPADFMFRLTQEEAENLRFQIGSSSSYGGRRYLPYAFTEQGVAMLSSVLRSPRAVQVNIAIMRAFVQLRQMLGSQVELARKLAELERRIEGQDEAIQSIFEAIRQIMAPPAPDQPAREIGFHVKEAAVPYRVRRGMPGRSGARRTNSVSNVRRRPTT
jgi:hypothetical protein